MRPNGLSACAGNIFLSCQSKVTNSGMLRKEYLSMIRSCMSARVACKKLRYVPLKFSFRSKSNKWMVELHMLAAAMPVGAVTLRLSAFKCRVNKCRIVFIRKDFPVPAVPSTTISNCWSCKSLNECLWTVLYAVSALLL